MSCPKLGDTVPHATLMPDRNTFLPACTSSLLVMSTPLPQEGQVNVVGGAEAVGATVAVGTGGPVGVEVLGTCGKEGLLDGAVAGGEEMVLQRPQACMHTGGCIQVSPHLPQAACC
jgi:hypothetical protein